MSPAMEGSVVLVATLMMLLSGIPVAFGLGAVAIVFLLVFHGIDSMQVVAETFYSGLDEFTLVAIPMFVMMGAAIGSSPAGKDLYEALDRWLYRVPGGLVISNIGACAIFAALTGSSPACCAAIGKMGIPEMRRRGYPDGIATGSICAGGTLGILIPPSITFILYGIATETSIGRLFIAGVIPGIMLTAMFMIWTIYAIWRSGFKSHAEGFRYSWKEKFASIPKIAPFLAIVVGVMYSLYGGVATPSEAAGVGAALCLILAILIYRLWKPEQIWLILRDTMRESVMILTIIAAAVLFGYMLTSLYLTQTLAQAIADAHFNRWVLMGMINLFLLVCGFFIPPAAVILMTSPILLPIIIAAGFDPVWFGVILTINMEIGLIHPPVGLNIYIVNAIAPDVPLVTVMWGTLPYVLCMMLAIVILCIFPEIATWLPDHLMGVAVGHK
ncbi:MAG: TRAP transporter large permease [Pseudolabrys sp.]